MWRSLKGVLERRREELSDDGSGLQGDNHGTFHDGTLPRQFGFSSNQKRLSKLHLAVTVFMRLNKLRQLHGAKIQSKTSGELILEPPYYVFERVLLALCQAKRLSGGEQTSAWEIGELTRYLRVVGMGWMDWNWGCEGKRFASERVYTYLSSPKSLNFLRVIWGTR